jgi:hypothetical protein
MLESEFSSDNELRVSRRLVAHELLELTLAVKETTPMDQLCLNTSSCLAATSVSDLSINTWRLCSSCMAGQEFASELRVSPYTC